MAARAQAGNGAIKIHGSAVEMIALGDLKPYAKNARQHPEDQLKALEAIIRDSGFTAPLIIDPQNGIVAGHGRALVAKRLGMRQVPCVRVTGLSEAQIRALRLSDNQAALRGTWDKDILLGELVGLQGDGFDLGLTAFQDFELGEIGVPGFLEDERLERAEETPEPSANPVAKAGELWLLGDHRLICGDSTDAATVKRLLDGATPHLMVTDPPYGVNYDPAWRLDAGVNKPWQKRAEGKVSNDHQSDWRAAWALFPGDVAYIWHADRHARSVQESLEVADFVMRCQIIWAKNSLVMGRGDYHWQHEPCWYAVRNGKAGHWSGGRKQSTLWQIANMHRTQGNVDDGKTIHGTQKPIECMRRPILNNSKPGDAIYEPFCGSGTTLIAAEMEKRRCYAVEIDPAYCEVAIRRWEKFTGKTATREDGKTLAQLSRKKAA